MYGGVQKRHVHSQQFKNGLYNLHYNLYNTFLAKLVIKESNLPNLDVI